ncbi:NADP oxidoreductase [Kineosporia sp. NBRC 101677]|uniref:NADPH-dependent F420 reductase n=1 Tax=Kineosporia sp. NBRC 101677 TaxID=3032197 RepID=UPI0024A18908|nr:NAD(P)-binding domain-containing protein [Kineosporia sp. NBRC 101677]GLY19707.1 NADP oxidoreductase [Kineosporia sp. NBRC 101677]
MATLGVIGTGNLGLKIAQLAIAADLEVVLSNSRGPESLTSAVAQLGERAHAATSVESAEAGDWVLLSVPLAVVGQLPRAALAGKVVLDTTNYYPSWRDGYIEVLDSGKMTTSELVQQTLPEALLVKAFANISDQHVLPLARPEGAGDRSAMPIAGDSLRAKASAAELISRLGYDTVDVGLLSESWRFEPETPASARAYFADVRTLDSGLIRVAELIAAGRSPMEVDFRDQGAPLSPERLRTLLDESPRVLTANRKTP